MDTIDDGRLAIRDLGRIVQANTVVESTEEADAGGTGPRIKSGPVATQVASKARIDLILG